MLDLLSVNHIVQKYLACSPLVLSDLSAYFEIHLRNCKGWQCKVDKGVSETDLWGVSCCCNHPNASIDHTMMWADIWCVWIANCYRIYPQPDLPGSDCFVWLLVWIQWLEVFYSGCELEPQDYIFPEMGANGIMQPHEPLSHDTVQQWVNKATSGAGIWGSFSSHCFWQGGAQYWFMFAPVGQHWPLAKVHW